MIQIDGIPIIYLDHINIGIETFELFNVVVMVMIFLRNVIRLFGDFGIKHFSRYFEPLKEEMMKSNLNILFQVYVGKMVLFTVLAFISTFSFVSVMFFILNVEIIITLISALIAGTVTSLVVLLIYHSYPYHLLTSKKNSINTNMPFAINHMGAISASGVPPFVIFGLMSAIPEYGEIANECKRVVRNVKTFGMDMVSAIRNVANRTPSQDFRQFLYGIIATTETGGDLKTYFENAAKEALFDYKLKREKYMQTLSTYADFYTAVLIAAPLFFVSTLSVLSLIGGKVFGLDIPTAIRLGVYILMPVLNTVFIMFIHYTQPSV